MLLNHIALMILAVIGFWGEERSAQFVEGQFLYSNWDSPWVTLDSCIDRNVEHLVIPEGINHNGRYYPIAEIGHDALRSMYSLTDVTIGKGCSFMKGAFKDCPRLSVIKINDTVPPVIGQHPFYGGELTDVFEPYHLEGTIIVVPPGTEEIYRNAPGWREFKYIQSTWPTAEEYHLDALDVRINTIEQELELARSNVERLQQELDALRQFREVKANN